MCGVGDDVRGHDGGHLGAEFLSRSVGGRAQGGQVHASLAGHMGDTGSVVGGPYWGQSAVEGVCGGMVGTPSGCRGMEW